MDLRNLGLTAPLAAQFALSGQDTHRLGRVMTVTGQAWLVGSERGEQLAKISGKLGHLAAADPSRLPVVGDWVALRRHTGTQAVIDWVVERRHTLSRPDPERPGRTEVLVSHVDAALIVMGLDFDYNLRRLERYLAMVRTSGAEPVVVLTKSDLVQDWRPLALAAAEASGSCAVHAVSALSGEGMAELSAHLDSLPTVVLIGSSGAGKSTLVQALTGEKGIATAPTRAADGRGRHTTVGRHLHPRPGGGCLIDTPGLRSVAVGAGADLADTFGEIERLARACRFSDCQHQGEPGCAVGAALATGVLSAERLGAWRKLEREVRRQDAKQDSELRAALRQQNRQRAKQIRSELEALPKRR